MDLLLRDLRYGLRTLSRSPAFTAVAALSLALGIGVNIAIFGFINAALFKPLDVPRPAQLVSLYHARVDALNTFTSTSYPEFEFYRAHSSAFSGMLAYLRVPMIAGSGAGAARISGELVSPGYFAVLGLRPVSGRWFTPAEHEPVAVISHQLWQSRFGGSASAVGAQLPIGNGRFTVVGIAPASFRGIVMDWAEPPAVWIPVEHYRAAVPLFTLDVVHAWNMESFLVTGRLRAGVTADRARLEIASLAARLRETTGRRQGQQALLFPLQRARFWPSYRGSILTFLGVLMTVVGAILLIACCNLANLLLARAGNRRREIAMRLALGAGRARIFIQLLAESFLLAAIGGAAALVVAAWASHFLARFHRAFRIPLEIDTPWDLRVLAFAVAVSALTAILFGAAPALQTWRVDLTQALRTGSAGGSPRSRLRSALLIAQIALSTVLLAGAGMFVRTLLNARAQDPTAAAGNLLLARLEPGLNGYPEERARQLYENVLQRARALPGVTQVALVAIVPFGGVRGGADVIAPGREKRQVDFNIVSPGHFAITGLPVLLGRDFGPRDLAGAPPVAVINELLAEQFWPGEDPLGKPVELVNPPRTATVVGVVRDGKVRGYRDTLRPGLYLPAAQLYRRELTLEVRTAAPAAAYVPALRREIAAVDPGLPLPDITPMDVRLDEVLSQERLIASFTAGLGLVALVLSAVGIYAVLAFAVARRTREIGIRMAMGARPLAVARMIVGESAAVAACGFALGALAAVGLARLAAAFLYGVTPADPVAFGIAFTLLAIVALAAALIPAWRAARLDPASTLRMD